MTTHAWKALGVGAVLLAGGIVLPSSAKACSAVLCGPWWTHFPMPKDAVVPANVPALVMAAPGFPPLDVGSLRLRMEDGTDVEAQVLPGPHDSGVLVPAAPLVPGTGYRLEGHSPCSGSSQEGDPVAATFTAGPALTLPTTSGTLQAGPEQHGSFQVFGGGSCSVGVEGSQVTLDFTPAPELVPFLPWVHWTLLVDGQAWATAPHGTVDAAGTLGFVERLKYPHALLTVYSVCDFSREQQPPSDQGLAPGRHVATLRPVLEQSATPLPSLEVSFELTCPTGDPEPEPGMEPETPPEPEPERPHAHGCSQSGGELSVLGALMALRLWRRKKM